MKLLYFAWVRERIGKAEEEIAPPSSVTTVGDLIAWLSGRGEVLTPLAEEEIERVVTEIAERQPEAVAVSFLFSYLDSRHEDALAQALAKRLPDVPVTVSSAVAREFREYPRTATAALNAGLRPVVGSYLALGGASYAPASVADPCAPRDWRDPSGLQEIAEQMVLSGLDGAACELGVSREEIVLAFESRRTREQFAREHGIDDIELEELVRSGLVRAVDDAERAGAVNGTTADLLRGLARRVPVETVLDLPGLVP